MLVLEEAEKVKVAGVGECCLRRRDRGLQGRQSKLINNFLGATMSTTRMPKYLQSLHRS